MSAEKTSHSQLRREYYAPYWNLIYLSYAVVKCHNLAWKLIYLFIYLFIYLSLFIWRRETFSSTDCDRKVSGKWIGKVSMGGFVVFSETGLILWHLTRGKGDMNKHLSLDSWHPDLDLKVRTPDCEAGVLLTRLIIWCLELVTAAGYSVITHKGILDLRI
jgi:hypothetical protein